MTPNELTAIYSPIITKVVSKMFGEDDREDAFQAIWLALLTNDIAGRHDPEKGPLEHFAYMAAKNAALDIKRATERHSRMDQEIQEGLSVLEPSSVKVFDEGLSFPEFEGTPEHKKQQEKVLGLLLQGYNQKEIAELEGCTTTWSNKLTNAIRCAVLEIPRINKDFRPLV
jgi:DNA-directed RNA polymerase specialized sigma24 family protein